MYNAEYIQQLNNDHQEDWAARLIKRADSLNDENIEKIIGKLRDLTKNIRPKQ